MRLLKRRVGLLFAAVMTFCSLMGCASKPSGVSSSSGGETGQTTGTTISTTESTSSVPITTETGNTTMETDNNIYSTTISPETSASTTTNRTRESTTSSATATTAARVSWSGPNGYTIVIPADSDEHIQAAAERLQNYFKGKSNVVLPIVTDAQKETAKEILVGKTNRSASNKDMATNAFSVTVKGDKLVVEGGHYLSVDRAVYQFTKQNQTLDGIYEFGGTFDLELTKLGKYQYVWGDEFDTDTLDPTKWELGDNMDGYPDMIRIDDPEIIRVEDSLLRLTAKRWYDPSNSLVQYATTYSVRTKHAMSYQYGYLEMRARVPYKHGAWPSFWLVSNGAIGQREDAKCFTEVDVFEVFSSTNTAVPNLHKWFYNGPHTAYAENTDLNKSYKFINTDGLSDEYHIYGFEWTDKEMSMYIDGTKYMTYDLSFDYDGNGEQEAFHDPLYIILNNHLFTERAWWCPNGYAVYTSDLPIEYDIDWIRLYQQPGVGALNLAE